MEKCSHEACSFEGRLEYCEIVAGDPAGPAQVMATELDSLLYDEDRPPVSSEDHYLHADGREQFANRSFSYLSGDTNTWVWPLTNTQLTISHSQATHPQLETYRATLGWRVEMAGATDAYYTKIYTMSFFPEGAVQTEIEEPDLIEGTRVTRRMVDYDYHELFGQLAIVDAIHVAERRDHERAS